MDDLIAGFGSLSLRNIDPPPRPKVKYTSTPPSFPFGASPTSRPGFLPDLKQKVQNYSHVFQESNEVTQETASISPTFPFAKSLCRKMAFLPDLKSNVRKYMQVYLEEKKVSQSPVSRASTVKEPLTLNLAKHHSNIQNYAEFCRIGNKTAQAPVFPQNSRSARTSPAPKRNFRFRSVRNRTPKQKIRTKPNLQPRDSCPVVLEIRKIATASEATISNQLCFWGSRYRGTEEELSGKRPDPCPSLRYKEFKWKHYTGAKRRSIFPHHVAGSSFLDPREYALLEKKICGAHKSKKLRNGHGSAPRIPSKQVIFDILSNENPRMSLFEEFLSSKNYGSDFIKSIPRTLTEFTCFSRLPIELQNLIWEHALPDHRLSVLSVDIKDSRLATGMSRIDAWFNDQYGETNFEEAWLCKKAGFAMEFQNRLAVLKDPDQVKACLEEWKRLQLRHDFRSILWRLTSHIPNWYHKRRIVAPLDPVSTLLQTSKGSRGQVLLSYEPVFERPNGSKQYCNFKSDAIYISQRKDRGVDTATVNLEFECYWYWKTTYTRDLGKVRHLAVHWKVVNHEDDDKMQMAVERLSVLFPNLERLTVDVTEESIDKLEVWDPHTSICSRQRFIGDAWFINLPIHDHSNGHADFALDRVKEAAQRFPMWKPIIEMREIGSGDRTSIQLENMFGNTEGAVLPGWEQTQRALRALRVQRAQQAQQAPMLQAPALPAPTLQAPTFQFVARGEGYTLEYIKALAEEWKEN